MRPAFRSTAQATAFALLLAALLALPAVLGRNALPPREQAYSVQGWMNGPYPWIRHEIFEESGDIDIAFLGSSHILMGIDTSIVQDALSQKLGRPAVVRTIAWEWGGYDGLYLIAQDLLEHRKVRQVVFYDEWTAQARNSAITSLFRFGDNASALTSLTLQDRSFFYLSSLLGMPRTLLSLVRRNLPANLSGPPANYIRPSREEMDRVIFYDVASYLGAMPVEKGYDPGRSVEKHDPFVPYHPHAPQGIRAAIHTLARPSPEYQFTGEPIPAWGLHFAHLFTGLAEKHGCQLVMLNIPVMPTSFPDRPDSTFVRERTNWPKLLTPRLTLVGVPANRLFAGLSAVDLEKLYLNPAHLNRNGMEYFTRVITPALLELYGAPPP